MTWRVAKSLLVLRDQIDALHPGRNKASDGTIGDSRHCPGTSDHCARAIDGADPKIVTAMDITHHPASGCDAGSIVADLVSSRDERIKYIIWNRRIINSQVSPWQWRAYNGSNPHTAHFHISVLPDKAKLDSTSPWQIRGTSGGQRANGKRYRVIARDGLRLREGPGTDYEQIGRLSPGDLVFVTATEGNWYAIDRANDGLSDGYAFGAYLVRA